MLDRDLMMRENEARMKEMNKQKTRTGNRKPATDEEVAKQAEELGARCMEALKMLTPVQKVLVSTKYASKRAVEQVIEEFKQHGFPCKQTSEIDEDGQKGWYIIFS